MPAAAAAATAPIPKKIVFSFCIHDTNASRRILSSSSSWQYFLRSWRFSCATYFTSLYVRRTYNAIPSKGKEQRHFERAQTATNTIFMSESLQLNSNTKIISKMQKMNETCAHSFGFCNWKSAKNEAIKNASEQDEKNWKIECGHIHTLTCSECIVSSWHA